MTRPIRVVHVIAALPVGGAEAQLARLAAGHPRDRFSHAVVCLREDPDPTIARRIIDAGSAVHVVARDGGNVSIRDWRRLRRLIAAEKPDVIQGWMYHGGLAALLGAPLGRARPPVLWNMRTIIDPSSHKPSTMRLTRAMAPLSRLTWRVVHNSASGAASHEAIGYDARRSVIIPNGFDTVAFAPSADDRARVRAQLGLPSDAFVVGHAGRLHASKDHRTLIDAVARAMASVPAMRLVLAGPGITGESAALTGLLDAAGIRDRTLLLGTRDDMPALLNAFDCVASSSLAEGTSNVVGEAMACGVPCVVTDIADLARQVADTGLVVRPGDPAALGDALLRVAALSPGDRAALGAAARRRIVRHYSNERMLEAYAGLYEAAARRIIQSSPGDRESPASPASRSHGATFRAH